MISGEYTTGAKKGSKDRWFVNTEMDIKANHRYKLILYSADDENNFAVIIDAEDYDEGELGGGFVGQNETFLWTTPTLTGGNGTLVKDNNDSYTYTFAKNDSGTITFDIASEFGSAFELTCIGGKDNISNYDNLVTMDREFNVTRAAHTYSTLDKYTVQIPQTTSDKGFSIKLLIKARNKDLADKMLVFETDDASKGGGGTIPPMDETGGVDPVETSVGGFLAVDSDGVLNLDGRGKLVFFKWGSVIGIAGGKSGDVFGAEDIAWVPVGYDYEALKASIGETTANEAWAKIPWLPGGLDTAITANYAAGTGDPCALAVKDGVIGGHRMPRGVPSYEDFMDAGWVNADDSGYGMAGRKSSIGTPFYPFAGSRMWDTGVIRDFSNDGAGYYWSSDPFTTNHAYNMSFGSWAVFTPYNGNNRNTGMLVRCLKDVE